MVQTDADQWERRVRDSAADSERELNELAGRLGLEPEPATEPLVDRPEEEASEVDAPRRSVAQPPVELPGEVPVQDAVALVTCCGKWTKRSITTTRRCG